MGKFFDFLRHDQGAEGAEDEKFIPNGVEGSPSIGSKIGIIFDFLRP